MFPPLRLLKWLLLPLRGEITLVVVLLLLLLLLEDEEPKIPDKDAGLFTFVANG